MKRFLSYAILLVLLVSLVNSCSVTSKKKRYTKKNYQELKKSFPMASVTLVQDSIKIIFPNNLVFDIGSAHIKEAFHDNLSRFAVILKKYSLTHLLINGYTDDTGTEDANLKLSLDRSSNVESILISKEIPKSRLFTWGLGEKNPKASNKTEEGRALNRRVEFVVLYKP